MPLPAASADDEPRGETGVHRLEQALAAAVEKGTYRAGSPLPKRGYLVGEFGVSPKTVTSALRRLAERGYVHKHGRCWCAGERRDHGVIAERRSRSMILVVTSSASHWEHLLNNERTRPFGVAFRQETHRAGVQIVPLVIESAGPGPHRGAPAPGLASTDSGYAYLGYAAFHVILSDVPMNMRDDRTIGAPAELSPGHSLVRRD